MIIEQIEIWLKAAKLPEQLVVDKCSTIRNFDKFFSCHLATVKNKNQGQRIIDIHINRMIKVIGIIDPDFVIETSITEEPVF